MLSVASRSNTRPQASPFEERRVCHGGFGVQSTDHHVQIIVVELDTVYEFG
jgi:hypothetical protein